MFFSTVLTLFLSLSLFTYFTTIQPLIALIPAPKFVKFLLYILVFCLSQVYWLWFFDLSGVRRIGKDVMQLVYPIIYVSIIIFFYSLIIGAIQILFRFDRKPYDMALIAISFVLYFWGFFNRYNVQITRYKLDFNQRTPIKIAFISDLHIGDVGMNTKIIEIAVEKINKENVDLVILGGDIIEKNSAIFNEAGYASLLGEINSTYGIFAVLGNHEYYREDPYYITKLLTDSVAKINVLNDEYIELGGDFYLIGREDQTKDYITKEKRKKINEIILPIKNSDKLKIVADHNPKGFDEAVENQIKLQLSGHTHNGQFFPFNLVVKVFYEKAYGLLEKNGSYLITSSGLGSWGMPIKLGSRAEVVIVEIR